jgi:hypothetical protein
MAVKITIDFLDNPTIGDAFSYTLSVAAGNILYNNGQTVLDLNYISGANTPLFDMQRKSTKPETINNTLQFLQDNWQHPNITYARVNDTIEVTINIADVVVTYGSALNDEITIDDELIADITEKLIYFADYTDPENNDYFIKIYKKGFTGDATKISGYGVLKYGSAKDLLDPIRGNGLDLNLEANLSLTLEDLYTEEENQFTVRFYSGNKLLFDGFLKPDGIYQSFVSDRWMLSLTCVDGLGILKDLAFVQSNGFAFTGRMNAVDVIFNCLRRTNLNLPINTSVNIYYEGLVPSDLLDPLTQVYLSVDRFKKGDYDTLMDCQEVLTSVLNLFNANICQVDGEWYIYKANEILAQPLVKFRRYLKNTNSFDKVVTKNFAFTLGSHVNGRYPHHAGGNQQIEMKGSLSSVRTNYKYGFVKSLITNPNLNHTGTNYAGWTVINGSLIILDPLKSQGLMTATKIVTGIPEPTLFPIVESNGISLNINDKIALNFRGNIFNSPFGGEALFRVTNTDGSGAIDHLKQDGTWTATGPQDLRFAVNPIMNITLETQPLRHTGTIKVVAHEAIQRQASQLGGIYELTFADVQNISTTATNGATGEYHTVQRQNRPSSIAKDTIEIFNGDSPSLIYEGTIYKADQVSPTTRWFRRGFTESKAVLRIAAEDNLRMSQKAAKIFTGDAYGFVPYLSVITIDSLTGVFMPIEWSFNTKTNTVSMKLLEGFTDELNDIKYTFNLDFGNTVKPTITS